MLLSFPSSLYSLHCFWWCDFYKHLSYIKDHERGQLTSERDFCLSGDFMVNEIVAKAKALGVTVHEYFLASISVAIYKVTEGRETNRVNFVQPVSIGESS